MVSDDENDQSATGDAFDVLNFIAGKRLERGRLTVVDATNVQPEARRQLVALAREHDVLPVAIVLDLPEQVCRERNAARADRQFGPHVLRRQRDQLRRGVKGLSREGFRHIHVLRSEDEVAAVSITRTKLYSDLRDQSGPFDIVGDIHGCRAELEALLVELGYALGRDGQGRSVSARHPEGRRLRLPRRPGRPRPRHRGRAATRHGHGVGDGDALCIPGNHENKLLRALRGRKVQITHGLAESLEQLNAEPEEFRDAVEQFLDGLISHYVLDEGRLVVAHAGLTERLHGRASNRVRTFCLYGQSTGETDEFGLPVRYPWAEEYRGKATVVYGHTPVPNPEWLNNTLCVDTGAVFGGRLTALRYPERSLVSVPAQQVYYQPSKPFPANEIGGRRGPDTAGRRDPEVLDLDDVMGNHIVETRYHGRITVREENAAAALEVMSRFALDPRWLVYLPPTMSPVATSSRPDLLEHPEQAFEAYRSRGAPAVVCEEKHMGSRAVALVCRSVEAAEKRFGAPGGELGAVWTRTGRPFFKPAQNAALARSACEKPSKPPGFSTSSTVTGCCSTPSSCRGAPRRRNCCARQYAAVGAAARSALPASVAALEQAAAAGLDVSALLGRTRARAANAEAFTAAYRRYCWETERARRYSGRALPGARRRRTLLRRAVPCLASGAR